VSTLRRTELRHKLLAEVAAGNVAQFGEKWTWGHTSEPMTRGEVRAMNELDWDGHTKVAVSFLDASPWRAVELYETGRALLSEWDAQYGKVEV
jgi:hypothetical protein